MRATAIARRADSTAEAGEDTITTSLSLVQSSGASQRGALSAHLTARQVEVLALLCEGLPNKLICRRLNISAGTVKAHISSILRELGVASRLQAVVWARHHGLVGHPRPAPHPDAGQDAPDRHRTIDLSRPRVLN